MKRQIKPQFFMPALIVGSALFLAGCGGGSANSFVSSPSSSTGGSGSTGGGSGGTISSQGISLTVVDQTQPVVTYVHPFYNFGTSTCSIASTATAVNDIQCLVNIRELDLFDQGLKLEFNAAPGMCDYVVDLPFSFYTQPAGYGPKTITVTWNQNGGASSCAVTNNLGVSTSGTMNTTSGICTYPGGTASASGTFTSVYDYTSTSGYNCTGGTYTYTGTTIASGGTPTVVTSSGGWGGLVGNCVQSPGKATSSGWLVDSTNNIPVAQVHVASTGFNQYYQITAPIKLIQADNYYAANFWGWSQYATGNQSAAAIPTAMGYSTDLLSNVLFQPNTAYTFGCFDTAGELKQRVSVYINEWDLSSQFLAYGASGSTTLYSPIAPQTCAANPSACDNFHGWPDYPTAFPQGNYTPR